MKIRTCFVSNSSSSSFIVSDNLESKGIACLKLSPEQKKLLQAAGYLKGKDLEKDYWLTEFLGDERDYAPIEAVEHEDYVEGDLGEFPRCEEYYNEYEVGGRSVFLMKEHDDARQMYFREFVKQYKNAGLPLEVIVRYESDGVKLIYVP